MGASEGTRDPLEETEKRSTTNGATPRGGSSPAAHTCARAQGGEGPVIVAGSADVLFLVLSFRSVTRPSGVMRPYLLALLSAALFGWATPASKVLLDRVDPLQLAGWLYLGAALGVTPAIVRGGGLTSARRIGRDNLRRLVGSILLGGVVGPIVLLLGLRLASAASVSLWLNLELVATVVLGHLFFRDRIGGRGWVAAGGVLSACATLSMAEGPAGGVAVLFVAGACLCWGLDNHLTALIDGLTPQQSVFWKGLAAGTFNLAAAALSGSSLPDGRNVATGLLVGAVSYGLSITLYIASSQQLGAARAQMVFATAPFFGAGASALLLGEPLGVPHAVAAALLVLSLPLLVWDRHEHTHAHEAMEHEHLHRHDDGHHDHAHPGLPTRVVHSHRHVHAPIAHSHPHLPDLHHRHGH